MTVELRPLGTACNLRCRYCYQHAQRRRIGGGYDIELLKRRALTENRSFSLFGGEPLLLRKADLRALLEWGHQRFGGSAIQTNGTLIDADHVWMFERYRVRVGVSIDGPGPLNDARWAGSLRATRAATRRTERAIETLCARGMAPSIILTLHRVNAAADRLPALLAWVRRLEELGVTWVRLHLLEADSSSVRCKYALSEAENVRALLEFHRRERKGAGCAFDLFRDMRRMLLGRDAHATCIWRGCDPLTTSAVRGIEGTGQHSNCGRTNKDGVEFVKCPVPGFERYLALHRTAQQHGGCEGCRFFLMCKGQCPGTALDGDWRNRTEHCEVWRTLFSVLEGELVYAGKLPLSLHPRRLELEAALVESWSRGQNTLLSIILSRGAGEVPAGISGWREALLQLRQESEEAWT